MTASNPITRLTRSRLQRTDGWRCRALIGSPLWAVLDGGDWPPDPEDPERITTLKRNPRNHSGLLHLPDDGTYFFKRFPLTGFRSLSRLTGRGNRARTNWRLSRHLQRHGVPVARAEALLVSPRENWFIAEALPTGSSLAKRVRRGSLSAEGLQTPLADLLAGLHRAGIAHGDLKWGNILLDEDETLRLIDLDSAQSANRERVDIDLARCIVSALELQMAADWVHGLIARYAEQTEQAVSPLTERLRPLVAQVSRGHGKRYRRDAVKL